ncbi:MAG: protein-L-isoaspartate(D-aspartate) O-methyltransferase [Bacillota bacterium]
MTQNTYSKLREKMVAEQLLARDINDEKVLEAFRTVPREEFVPIDLKDKAYLDRPLAIGEGQTISQPYIVAAMVQALELQSDDKILEIGTGSGYAAAIVAEIVDTVHGVERYQALAKKAQKRLEKLEYNNVTIHIGDGTTGWEESAPYDGIIVSAAAPEIPDSLIEQLVEGGYLIIPVGTKRVQQLYQVHKKDDATIDKKELSSVRFVPLLGEEGW